MKKTIERKKEKLQAKIDATIATAEQKLIPLRDQLVKYDAMLNLLNEGGL